MSFGGKCSLMSPCDKSQWHSIIKPAWSSSQGYGKSGFLVQITIDNIDIDVLSRLYTVENR